MEMTRKKKVAFAYIVYKYYCQNRKRKYWVHPFVSARHITGNFEKLFIDLRNDEAKFFNYFRMSIKSFDELHAKLCNSIKKQDTNMRLAIPTLEMLACTLRYLGSGCNLIDLHYSYRIGRSTLGKMIKYVCTTIWENLKAETFPVFEKNQWLEISSLFERHANFPNCLGAIDGKHIRSIKPKMSGSLYFNYKNYFSFVLLAVADCNYKFTFVDIGSFRKESDSTIFQNSIFFKKLENTELNIPLRQAFPGTNKIMPFVFVGDEAFALSAHVLRPFSGKFLSHKKRIFNYRLSRARRYVECSFGILSNKWRILHRPLNVNIDFAQSIVKASCVLHNYVRDRDGFQYDDTLSINGLENIENERCSERAGMSLNQYRNIWADYFISTEGALPWQDQMV